MTRQELLKLLVAHARSNGFKFKPWYVQHCGRPWVTAEDAIAWITVGRRYYALIFSLEFAQTFWKAGAQITFLVSPQEFQRTLPDGTFTTVHRKPYVRRSARTDVWKYHLREMSVSPEPLRYLRRYLHLDEEIEDETAAG